MNSLFVATTLSVLFVVLISASAEARSGEDLEDELMESQGDYSDYSMEPRKRSGWNSWGWGPAGKRSAPTVMSQSRNELCRLLKSLAAIPETAAVRQVS